MSESGGRTILAPLDASNLQTQGLLRQGSSFGTQRLHKRRVNRSSDEEHYHIPLDIPQNSSAIQDAFVTIPEALISRETLTHVGLSESKGDEIWSQWTNWPADGPRREIDADDGGLQMPFLDFIIGRMTRGNNRDTAGESDSLWYASLDACGIASDTQAAIMDPNFTYLRLSRSCLEWVRDTIKMRYAGLEDIQRASRQREMELERAASRPGSSSSGDEGADREDDGRRSIPGLQQQSMAGMSADGWARSVPGYRVLYRESTKLASAAYWARMAHCRTLTFSCRNPPTDFSGVSPLFYFTPDVKVAEYNAGYAKRRANCESVVIVVLCIPNAAIASLTESEILLLPCPSTAWKQVIWHGRNRKRLPSHLRAYNMLVSSSAQSRESLTLPMAGSPLGRISVLKIGADGQPGSSGRIATQFVISGQDEGYEWLIENGGKDIKVFPYPQAALERLIAGKLA